MRQNRDSVKFLDYRWSALRFDSRYSVASTELPEEISIRRVHRAEHGRPADYFTGRIDPQPKNELLIEGGPHGHLGQGETISAR